ncbi:gluconate:H+ symporter [Niastella populi]|uniref:Gluconate transporter n=1 Tax=Niastella populi TaxID=550983 RepID=A0A1V9FZ34_9BACT|nr:gluconate:H+ symporter [Niastella populi]OQP63629.1 gluconate transporter [Niastella populi]
MTTFLIILACIITIVLLISWAKFNPFLAFLIVSLITGWFLGIPLTKLSASVQKGIGDTLGSLVVIIGLGAMLGKLVAESGAAQKITRVLMRTFGEKHLQWALMATGFVVGIPLYYNVGFVLMVPLIFSVVYQYKLPAVYIGLPMLAALSVTHGFLPPHPSPTTLVLQLKADMGLTLLYGLLLAIPAIIVAGPLFSKTLKHIRSTPLQAFQPKTVPDNQLPSAANSFLTALLPVILLTITTIIPFVTTLSGVSLELHQFISDANIVMLISLLIATFTLGIFTGRSIKAVMDIYGEAIKDIALILLIVAGAGILKQVFIDSGVSETIAESIKGWQIHPLVLGWVIAGVIRVCVGSATVAGLTAAGIIGPVMPMMQVNPNLMVLSIGAGSLLLSHVNDSGFWMYKEYFNLSIRDTIKSWTVMETIVSVMGLIGVLIMDIFI